jgi:ectoine hydroxylase-related dioxygenase (phytanoyl-CoA dioxygenase family)
MGIAEQVGREGFGIVEAVYAESELRGVLEAMRGLAISRSRAGIRHVMSQPAVCEIAHSERMLAFARSVTVKEAFPFRATLFDKSPNSNWLVAWHQDTALPLREKQEATGWGPWSVKDGVNYAHAPAHALEQVVALRLHLDNSNEDNGPLRVLPGTQNRGVLSDDEIHLLSEEVAPVECCIRVGGVVLMRPLVVHASSKAVSSVPRRVLHIEYAACAAFEDGLELAVA